MVKLKPLIFVSELVLFIIGGIDRIAQKCVQWCFQTLTVDSYEADIQISPSAMETLRKFGSGNRHVNMQDAHAVLVTMVTRIRLPDGLQGEKRSFIGSLMAIATENLACIIQVIVAFV